MSQNNNKLAQEPWRVWLRNFFGNVWVEVAVGVLVIISVFLTLFEFAIEIDPQYTPLQVQLVAFINDMITVVFIIELTLRYFAAVNKRRFFSEFWLDIIATLPLFRIFRAGRALRLLRLVRIFRLIGVMSRLKSHYPYIFRRGAWDFLVVTGLLGAAIVFGTVTMMYFEHRPSSQAEHFDLEHSFWYSLYTLFAGEPIPGPPQTIAGKITTVFIMFMGLTIFAIFAGTVSAFMVDRLRMEGRVANFEEFMDHIVICGWSTKTEIVISEYRASPQYRKTPIIVITELDSDSVSIPPNLKPGVEVLYDDFTKISALTRAGIERAEICVIISDLSNGRSEQDADARTILAALTVEKINERVFTCAELINRAYGSHLDVGHVNEYVVSGEYSAYMLAQSSMNRGLVDVVGELLTLHRGNDFFRISIPESWHGRAFFDLMVELKEKQDAILIAVYSADGNALVNPREYSFQAGDEAVVIANTPVELT